MSCRFLTLALILGLVACVQTPPRELPSARVAPPPPVSTQVYFYPICGPGRAATGSRSIRVLSVGREGKRLRSEPVGAGAPGARGVQPRPPAGTDTAVGAVTGAAVGAAVSRPRNVGEGAIDGAEAGAVLGAASDASRVAEARQVQSRYDARDACGARVSTRKRAPIVVQWAPVSRRADIRWNEQVNWRSRCSRSVNQFSLSPCWACFSWRERCRPCWAPPMRDRTIATRAATATAMCSIHVTTTITITRHAATPVRSLPRGYTIVRHGGFPYYFHGGVWYRPTGRVSSWCRPPVGLFVSVLPPFYSTIWVRGRPFYYADDAYYVWRPERRGYEVTEPPAEADIATQSSAPDDIFIYPKNGQSEAQQASDRYECHSWAANQTGFDPTQSARAAFGFAGGGQACGLSAGDDRVPRSARL